MALLPHPAKRLSCTLKNSMIVKIQIMGIRWKWSFQSTNTCKTVALESIVKDRGKRKNFINVRKIQ